MRKTWVQIRADGWGLNNELYALKTRSLREYLNLCSRAAHWHHATISKKSMKRMGIPPRLYAEWVQAGLLMPEEGDDDTFRFNQSVIRWDTDEKNSEFADSYTYLIQAVGGGPVKIGSSQYPNARLSDLQTSHHEPLRIIGLLHGRWHERRLHSELERFRLHGEWFDEAVLPLLSDEGFVS